MKRFFLFIVFLLFSVIANSKTTELVSLEKTNLPISSANFSACYSIKDEAKQQSCFTKFHYYDRGELSSFVDKLLRPILKGNSFENLLLLPSVGETDVILMFSGAGDEQEYTHLVTIDKNNKVRMLDLTGGYSIDTNYVVKLKRNKLSYKIDENGPFKRIKYR